MRLLLGVAVHLAGGPAFTALQHVAGGESETNTWPMVFEWIARAFLYVGVPLATAGLLWYVLRRRPR